MNSVKDLERLIKLDLLLMGKATERDEIAQIIIADNISEKTG